VFNKSKGSQNGAANKVNETAIAASDYTNWGQPHRQAIQTRIYASICRGQRSPGQRLGTSKFQQWQVRNFTVIDSSS